MPALYDWYLEVFDGESVLANGLVTGHPKLPDGISCRTSPILEARVEGDVLKLVTRSNRRYDLPGEAMDPSAPEGTAAGLEKLGLAPEPAQRWARARQEADKLRRARQTGELAPGELLLEAVGDTVLTAFFRTGADELTELRPYTHVGMFQDSVLITDREGGAVDFRYFPREGRMEPYHISDSVTAIRLSNLGSVAVSFGTARRETLCPAGEVTVLSAAEHKPEWDRES